MRRGTDEGLMSRAAELARAARLVTPPNPWVGCVLALDGEIVGEGATGPYPAGPHAEVAALRAAGDRAKGASAMRIKGPSRVPCSSASVAASMIPGAWRSNSSRQVAAVARKIPAFQ